MRILRYGLELGRLKQQDIELVRNWRNADHVVKEFEFQEPIDELMHQKWFDGLSPEEDFYFVARHDGIPFAVVHLKQVNWIHKTAEAGIFTGNLDYLETPWPILSVLVLMEFAFGVMRLESLQCKIRNGNVPTEKFNSELGYKMESGQKEKPFRLYSVAMIDFFVSAQKLRETALKIGGQVQSFEADLSEMEFIKGLNA